MRNEEVATTEECAEQVSEAWGESMSTKCMLLDGKAAFGKILRPDGTSDCLCFGHYLSLKAKEPANSEFKYVPMKGNPEPPPTDPKLSHDWQRSGLGSVAFSQTCILAASSY
jgi:hypothetical protein